MKKIIIFLTVLLSYSALAFDCINRDEQEELKPSPGRVVIKNFVHTLVYEKDSCGARGCDIRVYSQVHSKCMTNSFNGKGFYVENTLMPKQVTISKEGKLFTYFYSPLRGIFEL